MTNKMPANQTDREIDGALNKLALNDWGLTISKQIDYANGGEIFYTLDLTGKKESLTFETFVQAIESCLEVGLFADYTEDLSAIIDFALEVQDYFAELFNDGFLINNSGETASLNGDLSKSLIVDTDTLEKWRGRKFDNAHKDLRNLLNKLTKTVVKIMGEKNYKPGKIRVSANTLRTLVRNTFIPTKDSAEM